MCNMVWLAEPEVQPYWNKYSKPPLFCVWRGASRKSDAEPTITLGTYPPRYSITLNFDSPIKVHIEPPPPPTSTKASTQRGGQTGVSDQRTSFLVPGDGRTPVHITRMNHPSHPPLPHTRQTMHPTCPGQLMPRAVHCAPHPRTLRPAVCRTVVPSAVLGRVLHVVLSPVSYLLWGPLEVRRVLVGD